MYNEIRKWTKRPGHVIKALMVLERFIRHQIKNSEIHDFMLGLESHHRKLNLEPPNQELPDMDLIIPYTAINKPELGTVYLNRAGEKKFFRCSDAAKYCDRTLYLISGKLAEERDRVEFRAKQKRSWMDVGFCYRQILEIIQYRLEYRNAMRRFEACFGLRKKGD